MIGMTEYLASIYPQYFRVDKYEHPVWGVRASLAIRSNEEKVVDIQVIKEININYEDNFIVIKTELGNHMIVDFIKDATVI
jgi:hypothetical protein